MTSVARGSNVDGLAFDLADCGLGHLLSRVFGRSEA